MDDVKKIRPDFNLQKCSMVLQQMEEIYKNGKMLSADMVADISHALFI